MTETKVQIRIRHVAELGYHNRFTRQAAFHYSLEMPPGLPLSRDPLPPGLAGLFATLLPLAETTRMMIRGETRPLSEILTSESPGFAWVAGALATLLQKDTYPGLGSFGAPKPASGLVEFYFEYKDQSLGRLCGNTAIQLAACLLQVWPEAKLDDAEVQLRGIFAEHKVRSAAVTLNQNLRAILEKADERRIPWKRIASDMPYVQLGQGCKLHRWRESLSDQEGLLATELQKNKILSHRILAAAGLPTPKATLVNSAEKAVQAASAFGYPVVLKPNFLAKGIGVFVGLKNEEEVRAAFEQTQQLGANVILEAYVPGDDHRLLVVGGRFIAAARRLPARIIGDGRQSVRQLVEEANRDPRRGSGYSTLMNEIVIDWESERLLTLAGLTLDSVPERDRVVELKRTANISSGGTAVDVTEEVHPENIAMAERAARIMGLSVAGVDFLTTDISRSHLEVGGAICEMNAAVGLRPHRVANPERDVVSPILEKVYPQGDDGCIPIAAVTGTTGKTTTVRMLAQILTQTGKTVGSVTTDEVKVAGEIVRYGDLAGFAGAEMVLGDTRCEVAVLETARGGLIKRGLAFERCDVAALTNVGEDHLGEHGVDTPEQMVRHKARLLQAAEKAVVLNANDPLVLAQRDGLRAPRILLVAPEGANDATEAHLASGGEVLLLETARGGAAQLVLRGAGERTRLLAAKELPSTLGGAALHNAKNALFAAALAHAMEVPLKTIRQGLRAFKPDLESSPGRLTLVNGLPFELLVDFAHNAPQLRSVTRAIDGFHVNGRRICLLTVPGNRLDEHIVACGTAAAGHFDRYICYERKEWWRGRPPRQIAELLRRGLRDAKVAENAIETGLEQDAAIARAVELATPGDLVAIFGSASVVSVPQFRQAAAGKDAATGNLLSRSPAQPPV